LDQHRFDYLTRLLAATGNRRTLSGWLARGATGAALALGLGGEAADAARCRKPGGTCTRTKECCGAARCTRKRCRCPRGRRACGKKCCLPGDNCLNGRCTPPPTQGTCKRGEDACSGPLDDLPRCNGSDECTCFAIAGGATFCTSGDGACAACRSSADCEELGFPAGSGCIRFPRGTCSGTDCDIAGGFCAAPCGAPLPPGLATHNLLHLRRQAATSGRPSE
jgi:hypothetical protein